MPATEPDGFPYPDSEAAANVPVDLQALADKLQEKYGAIDLSNLVVPGGETDDGKIAIVENGVVELKALSGDATVSESGALTIGPGKVGTSKIADKGVTTAKLNDGAVTEGKLADGAVTRGKIAGATLQTKRLTTGEIAAGGTKQFKLEWPEAFADTDYTMIVNLLRTSGSTVFPSLVTFSKTKAYVEVFVKNNSPSDSYSWTIEGIAVHD